MKRFPAEILAAMNAAGAAATCVPVQLEQESWEAALFLRLTGRETHGDRRALRDAGGRPLPVGLETDLIENASASVAVIRPEIHTRSKDPLTFEILLAPGKGGSHFEALEQLSRQPRLCWFVGDGMGWLLHAQQHPLSDDHHEGFRSLLADAVRHDALIRVTGRYDDQAAMADVVRHYELREGVARPG